MKSKNFVVYEADWDYRINLAAFPNKLMAENWVKEQPKTDELGLQRYLYIESLEYFECNV